MLSKFDNENELHLNECWNELISGNMGNWCSSHLSHCSEWPDYNWEAYAQQLAEDLELTNYNELEII